MLIALIVLGFLVAYVGAGVPIARHQYALATANPNYAIARGAQQELDAMAHATYCNLVYNSLRYRGCNCHERQKWVALKGTVESHPASIKNPWFTIVAWPVLGADTYLRSKSLPVPDYAYIQEMEQSLGIKELD